MSNLRYYLDAKRVKYKGKVYQKGDIFPKEFSEKDRMTSVYSHRIRRINVPEDKAEATNISELSGTVTAAPGQKISPAQNATPVSKDPESTKAPTPEVKENIVEPVTEQDLKKAVDNAETGLKSDEAKKGNESAEGTQPSATQPTGTPDEKKEEPKTLNNLFPPKE